MIRASVIAAALLFSPANVVLPQPGDIVVEPASIVQVVCIGNGYIDSGTAFRVGPNGQLLSVNHVTSIPNCFIGGKRLGKVWKSPNSDFSMVDGDRGPFLPVDCGGFVKGRKYVAIGFARGETPLTRIDLTATAETDGGETILVGMVPVIPGMSGGPVLDAETGKVVGVVNAENFEEGLSWSVPLSSTPVCKAKSA